MIVLIVTPTRNVASYLDETIFSVLSQRGDFEIYYHIQDSCSSDETLQIIDKWNGILNEETSPLSDSILPNKKRIKLTFASEKDKGMYDAVNRGFRYLLSESGLKGHEKVVMSWINGDDILAPGALQAVVDFFCRTDYRWVTGVPSLIREDSAIMHLRESPWGFSRPILKQGLYDHIHFPLVQQEGTFWLKSLWDEIGEIDLEFKLAGDWDLWRRFAEKSELITLRAVLGLHRRRSGQASSSFAPYLEEIKRSTRENKRDSEKASEEKNLEGKEYCSIISHWDAGGVQWVFDKQEAFQTRTSTASQSITSFSKGTTLRHQHLRSNLKKALKALKLTAEKKINEKKIVFGKGAPDIFVGHCEINDRHGTGILIKRIFKDDKKILSIRSKDLYGAKQDFGAYNFCLNHEGKSRESFYSAITEIVNLENANRILAVPYYYDDVLTSLVLKDKLGIPLCTYLMDDQNIFADNIPDDLMGELLRKADLRLGISKELCKAYEDKYGYKFWFLPPVVDQEVIQEIPDFPLDHEGSSSCGVLLGNIWSQKWLDNLRAINRVAGARINWYGNPNRDWIKFEESELEADGIYFKGYYPEEKLIEELRKAAYCVILTGSTDAADDRPELARLSLPSRLTYLISVANIPVIVIGNHETAAAKFVEEFQVGTTCSYDSSSFRNAISNICSFEVQHRIRCRAAYLAHFLSDEKVDRWIWNSLAKGEPINFKYEQFGNTLSHSTAVLTAVELNQRHGTGPLIKRVVEGTQNILSIRSSSHYQDEHDFGDLSLVISHDSSSREEAKDKIIRQIGDNTIERILCVPYQPDDLVNAITLAQWQKAPLAAYIMDDQNICVNNIPDHLMQELLENCSLRLATHPELREAYEDKYGLKFWLLPAIVPDELITDVPQEPSHNEEGRIRGALIGSIWSKKWFDKLSTASKGANISLDWYGNHDYVWLKLSPEECRKRGINLCGLLPEYELVEKLRNYSFVVVPTGTLDAGDDRKELSQLSLPGRILFTLATSNTPVIIMGSDKTPAAQFVGNFQTGVCCSYDSESFRKSVCYVLDPKNQNKLRHNAASIAKGFSAKGVSDWLWTSLQLGKPSDMRFEELFSRVQ